MGIYPETKTPEWFEKQLPHYKMEDLLIAQIKQSGINADRVILQSFSTNSLG